MYDNKTPLYQEGKPKNKQGVARRMLLYSGYIVVCVLSYFALLYFYRNDHSLFFDDFFVLIGVWACLSMVFGLCLYPLSKVKGAGLGLLLMGVALFGLNLAFLPLADREVSLQALQFFMLGLYFALFTLVAEMSFRFLTSATRRK